MNKIILLVLLFSYGVTSGQNEGLSNFVTLKSKGELPSDFTTLSSEKYKDDFDKNENSDLDKDFFKDTRFFIDELLLSGKVLFNEPLTIYVNKVAKYILRRDKKLFSELRFYVLKSTSVNAFSTDQGIIFLTTSLLAQLENEAQLAYILAHEISHFTENHVKEGYIEELLISKGKGKYNKLSYDSKISQLSIYSKDNELEADEKAIDIYLNSEYAIDEIFGAFHVLLYSYLPFDDISFDTTFFNTEHLFIPGQFFPDTINQISREEDYDDEGSTHPNIKKRVDRAFDYVEGKTSKGNLKFKISETNFFSIRQMARYETINLYLAQREYGKALYDIFLLSRDNQKDRFLDLCLIKGLYGLSKYKNHGGFNGVTLKPRKVEGESFKLHSFIKNMRRDQLCVIAYRHAYDMTIKYPNDEIFKLYHDDLKNELAIHSKLNIHSLKSTDYKTYLDSINNMTVTFDIQDSINKIDESNLSKYEKIKAKKVLRKLEKGETLPDEINDFHKFAFVDLVSQTNFKDELIKIKLDYKEQQELEVSEMGNRSRHRKGSSIHLGIKKIVIVDPVYQNYKLNEDYNHLKSEDVKINLSQMYMQDYKKINLDRELVDSKELKTSDIIEYNNLAIINNWVSELLKHDRDMNMICSTKDQMQPLNDQFGTNHYLFSGIYSYKMRHEPSLYHLYTIAIYPLFPLAIADLIVVHNYFQFVAFSVDSNKDQIEFAEINDVNLKGLNRILKTYIYDILYQISSNPKKNK